MTITTTNYVPGFLFQFWLSAGAILPQRPARIHTYDVYNNELSETETLAAPECLPTVFQDLEMGLLDGETRKVLYQAELAFASLQQQAQAVIQDMLGRTVWSIEGCAGMKSLPFSSEDVETLRKYFVFLRFRNSKAYRNTVESLEDCYKSQPGDFVYAAFRPLVWQVRLRHVLRSFICFLEHSSTVGGDVWPLDNGGLSGAVSPDAVYDTMETYCWSMCEAELCIGIATEEQEFMLSDRCFGTLDEGFDEDPDCCDFFFPIFPTLALYILGTANGKYPSASSNRQTSRGTICVDIGLESASDVHLRNAMTLQTYPEVLYFQSLRTVALSISSYDEFRWIQEHQDYSRLKQRCRQKFLQETVTKTLVVKGSIILTDLTDEVTVLGESAVAHGSFSDVWKGQWHDPIERKPRVVALKYLRQVMVQNVREKLLKRLQAEVLVWHRLCHRNVSQFFGIVQSRNTLGMVSQWCDNGTLCEYLKRNMNANRLNLLSQVASGIAYLHTVNPIIIHGDLKGGNILVDIKGNVMISDFGLSKVIEEMSDPANKGTSFFAGSTRWMAPELIFAQVDDDGPTSPPISTCSDVYAFASVCLEVASGHLPFPTRLNDYSVTAAILRGIRPTRSETCFLTVDTSQKEAFWQMLEQCWSETPLHRPTMPQMRAFFEVLESTIPNEDAMSVHVNETDGR